MAPPSSARRVFSIATLLVVAAGAGSLAAARILAPKIALPRVPVPCPGQAPVEGDGGVDFDRLLDCGKALYSQYREELIIRHFFRDRRDGVFLDVGSAHYKSNSTTYYLEHHLGWRGVAVDAVAEYGPEYVQYRPATQFFSYLVTDHGGTKEPFYKLKGMYLMSTESKDWAERFGRDDYEVLDLATTTMDALLAKAGYSHVDFVSMDIETGEPAALAGFDIDRARPALVCVEVTEGVRDRVSAYFATHGYVRIHEYEGYDEINWYFRPRV